MLKRWTLAAAAVGLLAARTAPAAEPVPARAPRPNVVFLLADDLGYSDLGCYGGEIPTPNLDRLAADGVRFSQFYNTARCWPSRAALLGGYYAQQVNRDPQGRRPAWAVLLPELLRPAGYRSYHSGKWHVDGPVLAAGFERSYQVVRHNDHFSPAGHEVDDKAAPAPEAPYYTTVAIADRAIDWLGEHRAKHVDDPFFLYVAFTSPHFPIQAPPEDIARHRGRYVEGWDAVRRARHQRQRALGLDVGELSERDPVTVPSWNLKPDDLRRRIGPGEAAHAVAWDDLTPTQKELQATKMAIHAAMVDRMDREIGRVLEKVRAIGAEQDTLVVFASDNGASAELIVRGGGHDRAAAPGSSSTYLSLGPGWSTAANTPFRLHKSWAHEGGISTPLIARWPAGIAARGEIRRTPGHLVDVAPTLLDLAGLPAPESAGGRPRPPLPGRSLAPAFAAEIAAEHTPFYFRHEGNRALRRGDWKIVAAGAGSAWELYNLAEDRSETTNLAAKHPEMVVDLAAVWTKADEEYRRQGAEGKPLAR